MHKYVIAALFAFALAADAAEDESVKEFLAGVRMGEPLVGKTVALFPLRLAEAPADAGVLASTRTGALEFLEPDLPRRRYNVTVRNSADKPVLLAGGTVLVGGHLDRLVRRDHLIGPGAEVEIRTLPAASGSDRRKEAASFTILPAIAPIYLRRKADFGGSPSLVPSFVAKWADFRDEGDNRRSLAAIIESKVLKEFALDDRKNAGVVPDVLKDDKLVGAVAAVRGRVQSLILYSTNDLALSYLFPLVEGASVANAAIVLRARKLGVPVPGTENPEESLANLKEDAAKFMAAVRKARFKRDDIVAGEAGEVWLIGAPGGLRGRAVVHGGRVIHLVVYFNDPFESKLYGGTVRAPLPGEDADEDEGRAELGRKEAGGRRLSESERRLLGRMGTGPGGGGGGRR